MGGKRERKQTPEPLANVAVEHKHHKTHNQPCSPLSANPTLRFSSSSSEDDSSEVLPPCAPSQPVLGSYPASSSPAALVSFHLLKQRPGLLAAEMQVLPWGEAWCADGEWGCDHTVSIRSWVRDWEKLREPLGEQRLELAAVVTVVVDTDWD